MPDLQDTRRKVKIALAALALTNLAAAALLFSPLVGSPRARDEQMKSLWRTLQVKTREVGPLRGLDKKVVTARGQIDDFYNDRLPSEDSAIAESLGKLASANGVKIGEVKYKVGDPEPVGLRRVSIDADFSGDYLQLVRFLNELERSKLFFLVDSVELGGEQGGVVKLGMKLETYLKTGA
ncbi:MAG TPA: GspMb/PilO family protein [Terriglobales bacterium]|nr:GspMb/PilO family protein [Terriglobales bacterium]